MDLRKPVAFARAARSSIGVLLLSGAMALAAIGPGASAQTVSDGTIAYISADRRAIHLVAPDGSNDRRIWGIDDPDVAGIHDIAWRPDGAALAFASSHESSCSIAHADLYTIAVDGSDYARITNGPACDALSSFETGSVAVEIANGLADVGLFVVYVQGAPGARVVPLSPGSRRTIVFDDVADLGDGVLQATSVAFGSARWIGGVADVVPGAQVAGTAMDIVGSGIDTFGALTASWSPDGTRIAYQLGQGVLWQVYLDSGVINLERSLFADDAPPMMATDPRWSPVADEVMYLRYDTSPSSVEITPVNGLPTGEPFAYANLLHGIDWLPDGSGWVASDEPDLAANATDLYLGDLRGPSVAAVTRNGPGEHAWWPAISPDGDRVAYTFIAGSADAPEAVELRLLDLTSGQDELVATGGIQPAWSRASRD